MQAWALNSANPTARLNKQKQNRSRTSASNHAFDSKLHYRVCSWTGTAIACPVSAEEKAPQQAGYAAMNGFLPAGHASPAPMSAPAPVTRDAAPQLQQASASIDGCIVAAGYANSWYSNYQRNNKRSGIKNLRCFPSCNTSQTGWVRVFVLSICCDITRARPFPHRLLALLPPLAFPSLRPAFLLSRLLCVTRELQDAAPPRLRSLRHVRCAGSRREVSRPPPRDRRSLNRWSCSSRSRVAKSPRRHASPPHGN